MRRFSKRATIWAFTVLYGGISLLGSGWHAVVGHAYHGQPGESACAHACGHAAPGSHDHDHRGHSHAHAGHSHAGHAHADEQAPAAACPPRPGGDEREPSISSVADHDCPLCRFFAQALWLGEAPCGDLERMLCDAAATAEDSARPQRVASYRSRAPPERGPC